jgi:hypothetical protein
VIEKIRKWKTEGRAFPASAEAPVEAGARRRMIETT